ncbi:MAG TPA: hypothetical protein VGC67_15955 [Cellulomonas sp.]
MNMSIARAGRPSTRILSVAAAAVTTVVLLAGCSSGSDSTTDSSESAASTSAASTGDAQDVQVIDQTNLLLTTAQETLEARGLVVQVADASGQGRTIDDPTEWVVVTQDPISGTVPAGTEVTITARMTTDPIG